MRSNSYEMDERLTRNPQSDEKYFQTGCSPGFTKLFRGHSSMKLLSQFKLWSRNSGGWGCKGDSSDVVPPSDGKCRVAIDKVENNIRHICSRNSHGSKSRKDEKSMTPQFYKFADVTSTAKSSKGRAYQSKICSRAGNISQDCIHCQEVAASLRYPQCYCTRRGRQRVKLKKVEKESHSVVNKVFGNRGRGTGCRSIRCNGELDKNFQSIHVNEMIEALIDQKLGSQDHFGKSRTSNTSEESEQFWDVLQILKSNKEVLWKILDDPDSLLAKHIQEMQDSQAKEQCTESSRIKKLQGYMKGRKTQSKNGVDCNFVQKKGMLSRSWKRFKSLNKILIKRRDDAENSNRIMILKPVLKSSFNIDFKNHYTSLELAFGLNTKAQATKGSRFYFGHIRRKLKLASDLRRKGKKHLLSTSCRLHGHRCSWQKTEGDFKKVANGFTKVNHSGGIPSEAATASISELSSKKDMDKVLSDENPRKVFIRSLSLPEYNSSFLIPEKTREHKYDDPDTSYQLCDEGRLRLCRERKSTFVKLLRPNVDALALDIIQKLEELLQYPRTKTNAAPEKVQNTQETIVTTCKDENSCMEGLPQLSSGLDIPANNNEKDLYPEGPALLPSSCDASRIQNIENQECAVHNIRNLHPITKLVVKELSLEVVPKSISTISRPEPDAGKLRQRRARIRVDEPRSVCAPGIPMEEPGSTSNYVKEFLLAAGLTWNELFEKGHLSDQLLHPALLNELEARKAETGLDSWLLFDYINEVLVEVHQCFFGCSPFLAFLKQKGRTVPSGNDVADEVIKRWIDWDLILQIPSHSLEELMKRDFKRCSTWTDVRADTEGILSELSENILEDMIKELCNKPENSS